LNRLNELLNRSRLRNLSRLPPIHRLRSGFDYLAPFSLASTPMLVSRGRNPSAGEILTQLSNQGLRDRVLTTLGLLLRGAAGDLHPCARPIDRVAFRKFPYQQGGQLSASLDNLHRRRQSPPSACFALGILPFHVNRFDHPAAAHSGPFPSSKISRERRGGRTAQDRPDHPLLALGWGGAAKAPSLPLNPAAVRHCRVYPSLSS